MSDRALASFDDLTEPEVKDYPGRRQPALRTIKRKAAPVPTWDADPVYYVHGGERKEFFTIRHLAAALDYSQQSIRAWENAGLLPKSGYRSPKPRKPTIGGRNTKGKRLWTRKQIEGLLKVCKDEGVITNKQPPTKAFARKVSALWRAL